MAYYGQSPLFAHSSCDSFYGLFWLHLPAGLLHLSGFYKLLVTSSEEVLHQFLWTLSTWSPRPSALLGLHTTSLAVPIALSLSVPTEVERVWSHYLRLGAPEPYSWCQDLPNVGYMKFLRWASVDHIWLWCSVVLMWFTPLIVNIPNPHSMCIQMVGTRRSQGCQ